MFNARQALSGRLCKVIDKDDKQIIALGHVKPSREASEYVKPGDLVLVVCTLKNMRQDTQIEDDRWVILSASGCIGWLYDFEVESVY